ncbi:hypothetical protein KSP40_PGU022203 [Platanthera guangdongensis]|uniref:Uncharacterized protein n=1 Tax=Platanthera guangdongensis TaxID=2320717 RepID=A0ABR2M2M1_9ASPA
MGFLFFFTLVPSLGHYISAVSQSNRKVQSKSYFYGNYSLLSLFFVDKGRFGMVAAVMNFIGATMGAADLNIQTENGQIGMPTNICCVIVEYLPGGALKTYLIKNHRRKLAFKVVVQLALDRARG